MASIGLNFTALFAGYTPASKPIKIENTIANTASHHGITDIAEPSAPMPPIMPTANLFTINDSV